ncbi:helix-turn-helix domain-containing protein [Candidatus Woesearchaeota archaeon]|nr:helix-turn-helix domain-containing protein [Candidatus Woesearchaeota archaeon]
MPKEKFILVSLKEEESKELAQIITNRTSRKILDALAEKESTESELSGKLNIPISTIHYNLQALLKAKLVEADEYHYSKKGKEVLHYKLANKYIIIAPKSTFGLKEKLKSILPAAIIAIAGSFAIYAYSIFQKEIFIGTQLRQARTFAEEAAVDAAPLAVEIPHSQPAIWQSVLHEPALWFLFGCIVTLILIIIGEYIYHKRNR